ncbi:MAG TPA: lytic transglycosylase domain-containing protein [Pseudonocardiaceae bacterium]|nr:lytic transglycosylase domain-containing protein [Pseudonocardiaceae bacterium]
MAGILLLSGVSQSAASTPLGQRDPNGDHAPETHKSNTQHTTASSNVPHAVTNDSSGSNVLASAPHVGVPSTVFDAYQKAAATMAAQSSSCRLTWALLAGIGKVESDSARNGDVAANGELLHPILGPLLNGTAGAAAVPNTVGTEWGQNGQWERAVGSMQFLPSTWQRWGSDGNGDGVSDPNNVYDASLAAARYLCAAGGDLSTPAGLDSAIFSYNHSAAYVGEVLQWMQVYQSGGLPVPDNPGSLNSDLFNPPNSSGQSDDPQPNPQANQNPPNGNGSQPPPKSSPPPQQPGPQPPVPSLPAPVNQVVTLVQTATGALLPLCPAPNPPGTTPNPPAATPNPPATTPNAPGAPPNQPCAPQNNPPSVVQTTVGALQQTVNSLLKP